MKSPEDKLQEQAVLARAVRAEQKIIPQTAATDATVIDFDADIGKDVVQLSDGSIRYATPLASGVRGAGDTVLVQQSGTAYSDALPHIKKRLDGKRRKVPQAAYKLRILAVFLDNTIGNKYYFYVGSESQKIQEVWTNSEPHPDINLDYEYYLRLDNLDSSKKDEWAITSLWNDDRIADRRFTPDPGIGISIDKNNVYTHAIYSIDNTNLPGAYFFGCNCNTIFLPSDDSLNLSATRSYSEVKNNDFDIVSSLELVTASESSTKSKRIRSFFNYEGVPSKNIGGNFYSSIYYLQPLNLVARGGFEEDWLDGGGRSTASYSLSNRYNYDRENNITFNVFNSTFTLDSTANFIQKMQVVYKDEMYLTELAKSVKTNSSGSALRNGNINTTNVTFNSVDNYEFSETASNIQIMPGVEEDFKNNYHSEVLESGYVVNLNLSPIAVQEQNKNEVYVQPFSGNTIISTISPFDNTVGASSNRVFLNRSGSQVSDELLCVPNLISSDGNEAIVHISEFKETDSFTSRDGDPVTVIDFLEEVEGRYYYQKEENKINKFLIEFSGIFRSYSGDKLDTNRASNSPIAYTRFSSQENFYSVPSTINIGDTISFTAIIYPGNEYYDSSFRNFVSGQRVEYEFLSDGFSYYGFATVTSHVWQGLKNGGQMTFRIDTKEEINRKYAEFIFDSGYGSNLLKFFSMGYTLLDYSNLQDYYAAPNTTLKNQTIYRAIYVNDDFAQSLNNAYKVLVDSYRIKIFSELSVYLERQKIKVIKCPKIQVEQSDRILEHLTFAYSE